MTEIGSGSTEAPPRGAIALAAEIASVRRTAALFLPLTFLTGLFGMNLGGVPGGTQPWAFAAACAALVGLLAIEVLLLRQLDWLRDGLPSRRSRRPPADPGR